MAIITLDSAIAGMQPPIDFMNYIAGTMVVGRSQSTFYSAGFPGPGFAPTPGIGGEVLTSLTGDLPFANPTSGNTYLARFQGMATTAGTLFLCDRLWQNSNLDINHTGEQVFTGAQQIPPRDVNGTNNGVGVYAGVEVSTATTGSVAPTLTLKYTNSAGVTDKTGTNTFPTSTASILGTFYQIGLAAEDLGIQKAQSLTLSSVWTAGVIHVVLYRILARLEMSTAGGYAVDGLNSGFVRAYDNTVPFVLWIPNSSTAPYVSGQVIWTQG